MEIKNNTYCGRCGHRGLLRETRKAIGIDQIDVVYSCLNPKCEKVSIICVSSRGNKTKKKNDMLGNIYTVSKTFIKKHYYPERERV